MTATTTQRHRKLRDRIVELVRIRAGDLAPNPANWRRHPDHQRAALRALLRQIGYADALIARRVEGELVLLDGHLRQSLDPDQVVPVLVVDLSDEEADLLLASLDPLAALATTDQGALAELLARVTAESDAVASLLEEIARGAGLPRLTPLVDPEEIPPPPARPKTRPGDRYRLGDHRLVCGDATDPAHWEAVMQGERAAMLWTDPPYGVDYVGKTRAGLTITGDGREGLQDLLSRSFAAAVPHLAPGAAVYVAHPAGPNAGAFLQAFTDHFVLSQTLVWVKDAMVVGHGDYHYRHEPILYGHAKGPGRRGRGHGGWYGGNGESSVFEVPRPKASPLHPTAKPVQLIARMVRNSSAEGEIVLDPFAGSGSTLMAAALHGRRARVLELDPRYCDVIVDRFEQVTGERAVREPRNRRD